MATINIGLLRKRVILQRRSIAQDTTGEQVELWQTTAQTWASIEGLSAREQVSSQAVHATDTHEITMRYVPGLTAKDRVVYRDQLGVDHVYSLTAVQDESERHRVMICTAVEGMGPG